MTNIDNVIHNKYHEIDKKFTELTKFKAYSLDINREEMHKIIYKCVMQFWEM